MNERIKKLSDEAGKLSPAERVELVEGLREHARVGVGAQVTFVGLGDKFQIWEPRAFESRRE